MPKPSSNLPVPTRKISRQATSRVAFVSEPPSPDDPLLAFEPYIHKQPRSNSITPDLQREFVAHLAATGIVTSAARHIGKSMEALYKLRHMPGAQGFASAWDRAVQLGVERLEDTALARAIEGSERKIIRGGEVVATERFHNESLVMFFLRNRLADRYASNAHIHPGHPIYERIRAEILAEVEAERLRQARDPENIRKIRESIDRKVEAIRRQVEREKAQAKAASNARGEDEGEETRL